MKIFPIEPTRHMLEHSYRVFIDSDYDLTKALKAFRERAPDVEIVGWIDPLTKELKKDHPFLCNIKAASAGWKCLLAANYEEEDEEN